MSVGCVWACSPCAYPASALPHAHYRRGILCEGVPVVRHSVVHQIQCSVSCPMFARYGLEIHVLAGFAPALLWLYCVPLHHAFDECMLDMLNSNSYRVDLHLFLFRFLFYDEMCQMQAQRGEKLPEELFGSARCCNLDLSAAVAPPKE